MKRHISTSDSDPVSTSDSDPGTTDWSPLKGGGTNFATRKLVQTDPEIVVFKPTVGAILFYCAFLVPGLLFFGGGVVLMVSEGLLELKFEPIGMAFAGFGLVFSAIGAVLYHFGTRPIVFDKRRDYFWKGGKDPDEYWNRSELKDFAELDNVRALQILSEYISGDSDSKGYRSYELNLVLDDGSRLNVTDHGNAERLVEDAEALAEFLGVPVLRRRL